MLTTGSPAPNFSLPGSDGMPHTLSDHRGSWVVVYFYPKDSTPGCTVEACDFRDSMTVLIKTGVTVYGISKDSIRSHQNFAAKQNLNFVLLTDKERLAQIAFGTEKEGGKTQRSTFLIDPKGNIAHVWPKVSVKGHVTDVLEKLKELP